MVSRNVSTSGYSSFTDSQYFFGSQFWPENSQGTSQDMSLSSRNSQQSSEGSDPKLSSSYQTRPLLFGELKDKSKAFGILDRFEEDKKGAKEKTDGDILAKESNHFRETLNNIQQLVADTERNTAICQTVIEKFDNFSSTLENNLNSFQSDISQKFETLLDKVNSQREMMTELEDRVRKSGDPAAEFGSNLQNLKNSLECLREEQERERNMLQEVLKLLSTLVSEPSAKQSTEGVMDSAIQTSPGLEQPVSDTVQENKLEGTPLKHKSYNFDHYKAGVPPRHPSSIAGKRKLIQRGNRLRKKRPLVPLQRRKRMDENSPPPMNFDRHHRGTTPLCERREPNTGQDDLNPDSLMQPKREMRSIARGCFITPLSCWSQDSNSSMCLAGVESVLEKLSAESRTATPVRREGLWQLFDMDCDLD